eukprot:3068337-Ditylum_brightwellii.AAC.1
MAALPYGWHTENINTLTTLACEYLATVLSNRERNKLQQELAKNETKMTTKTDTNKDRPSGGTQGGTGGGRNDLQLWKKEILKEIDQGKHTEERKQYWQVQPDVDKCYFHQDKTHLSPACFLIKNAIKKASDDGIQQGSGSPQGSTTAQTLASAPHGSMLATRR